MAVRNQDMKNACKYGNINKIAEFLQKENFDVNEPTQPIGETYLMIAAQNGHFKAVADLLKAKAEINLQDIGGETALQKASAFGYRKVVDDLLKRGADIKLKDGKGNTALHAVGSKLQIEEESIQTLETLLVHFKAENLVDVKNNAGETALHKAAEKDFSRHINKLLHAGADIRAVDEKGETPLHKNVLNPQANALTNIFRQKMNDPDVRKCLLGQQNKDGETPLHRVARKGLLKNLRVLKELGADSSIVNNNGMTPLHVAARNGQFDKVKELLEREQETSKKGLMLIQDNNMDTFIHAALKNKQDDTVRQILDYLPNPLKSDVLNNAKCPVLLLAVQLNNKDAFR